MGLPAAAAERRAEAARAPSVTPPSSSSDDDGKEAFGGGTGVTVACCGRGIAYGVPVLPRGPPGVLPPAEDVETRAAPAAFAAAAVAVDAFDDLGCGLGLAAAAAAAAAATTGATETPGRAAGVLQVVGKGGARDAGVRDAEGDDNSTGKKLSALLLWDAHDAGATTPQPPRTGAAAAGGGSRAV
jgi:hypothetical protein